MRLTRWVLGRKATLGYAIAVVAVITTGIAGFWAVREARQAGDATRRVLVASRELTALLVDLVDAETGQRGYLLSNDPTYLDPYRHGVAGITQRLDRLDRLVAGDPAQLARIERLRGLIGDTLAELQRTIELNRDGRRDDALAMVRSNRGRDAMDRLRALINDAEESERRTLSARAAERNRRFQIAGIIGGVGSALALLIVAVSTLALNRGARDRLNAERLTRESEERLRVTLRSIGDAVIATDVGGRIVFMNPVAEALTGWREAEARARPLDEVFAIVNEHTRETVESPVAKVLREGAIVGLANHTMLLRRGGSELPIDDSGAPIRDGGGEIMGVVLVFRDVSDRKQIESERESLLRETAARRDAERASRAKDEFLAVLSHELRSPLQGIVGWLAVLKEERVDAAQRERAMQAIDRGVRQQAQLVNDLLDASRIVAGKLELERKRVNLAGLVDDCIDQIQPQARDNNVVVNSEVEQCGTVLGDRVRLQQSVANLLANAIKFTPSGGRIDVTCRRADGFVVVTVQDSGEGIAPEFLPHLFDRFSQASRTRIHPAGGLGLGLSIARQIIELHGGSISAESAGLGHGATFIMRVPMAPDVDDRDVARADEPSPRSSLTGLSVLVVDDDDDTRESLSTLLGLCGASVRSAGSVADALAACAADPPQVLVSDISMPDRDGYDLISSLRAQASPGPIALALTGFAGEDDRARAVTAGFDAHVSKPVDLDVLVSTIRSLLPAA